jgi:biopolymer transport protein ExbD/biopolymer transport protein TolR
MAAKTKKFKVDPLSKANSDINVTPLVDVVLVLLIIFMVVTPLMEKDIQVRIPESEQPTEPLPPPDVPQTQIVLSIRESGEYVLNNETVPAEQLTDRLKRMLAAKAREDKNVFFMPEEKSSYGLLIAALDMARAADRTATLGMVTQEIAAAQPGAEGGEPPPPPTP